MKKHFLYLVLLGLLCSVGNVWGAGTTAKSIPEGDQYYSAYAEAKTNLSTNNWVTTSGGPGNSATSYTAPSGWLNGGSGKPGYGLMTVQSGKTVIFTVTNITSVSILGCSYNSSKTINLSVKDGSTEVGTVASKTTSSTSTPEVLTYGTALDKTKTYTITISASDGNNAKFHQIKFVGAAATTYSITYDLNGGSGTKPTESDKVAGAEFTLHDGTTGITAPGGKVFDGWLCNIDEKVKAGGSSYTMTAANTTFTAQWRTAADKHHVVYYGDGATGTLPTQEDVEEGQKFIVASADGLTAPSSGMVFRYWNDGVDNYEPGDEYTMETTDVELTAVWAQAYAVYFNTKGGSVVESQQVVEGETVAQPGDPTRPLSTFGGWYTDEECTSAYDFSTTITSATTINASNTLYAKWTFSTVTPGVYDAEQYVLDHGVGTDNTTAYVNTLTVANLALSNNDALDTYNDDKGKPAQNYPYLGLKIKTNNATLQGWIPADCYVVLKVGHMTAAGTASWKGANTSIASSDTRNAKVYIFEPANEPSLFTFTTNTASTCVLKSIEVRAANAFPTYSSLVHTPDGYASFFSDYDVQIPAGVKANIGSFNESTSELTLTDIDGDIIPHQTAVILKGVGELTVLTALPSQSSQPEGNDLVGVNKEKPKSANGHDGGDVYVLGYNNDAACLASYAGSNLGANKAWLPVVAASAPSIRIIEANENATALDNMESTEKVVKIIENGQLFILKDGVRYNAIGQIVQ